MTDSRESAPRANGGDLTAAQWYVLCECEDGLPVHQRRECEKWRSDPGNATRCTEFALLQQRIAALPRPGLPSAAELHADIAVAQTAQAPSLMIAGRGRFRRRILHGGVAVKCAGVLLLALLGGWFLDHRDTQSSSTPRTAAFDPGSPFSDSELQRMRAAGRPVFVNLRASWCPTCTANERTVLARNPVQQMMTRKHVAYLTGDWTLRDPRISAELRRFGRNGVPLYLLFSPDSKEPMIFPQVLTEHVVLRELERLPDPRGS